MTRQWASRRDGLRMFVGLLLLMGCTVSAGCGGNEFAIAPARGVVRLSGRPAIAGHVLFLPVGGGQKAIGKIGPDGAFILTSYRDGDGAQVGEHQVAVVKAVAAGMKDKVSYRCDEDHRLRVVADADNQFTLDVDLGKGWQVIAAD